jgi:hypothetical protein
MPAACHLAVEAKLKLVATGGRETGFSAVS